MESMSKLHDATNTILRAEWFRTSLTHPDSHVPRESMAEIVSLWNEAIGAADASHTGYMAKVQPTLIAQVLFNADSLTKPCFGQHII